MGVHRVLFLVSLSSCTTPIFAQVIIRERMVIDPKPQIRSQPLATAAGPLLRFNGSVLETTTPGVIVTGSLNIIPTTIPENTAYEVWVNVGGSSHLLSRFGTGFCVDTTLRESSPFPATLAQCGVISMSAYTFVPAPWQWSCSIRGTGIDLPLVSGNSATMTAQGTLWTTGFTATLTITASLDESYLPSRVVLSPQSESLTCNGAALVDVALLDGHGNLYTACGGSQMTGTASIDANGDYAYLALLAETGKSIHFPVVNGRGGFLVALDTSKGIIDGGYDVALIHVQVEGIAETISIPMSCKYPSPAVAITYPGADTSITLTEEHLPILIFSEVHDPAPGEQFEPSISWSPGPTLATAEYYERIQDSLVIPIKVTATNPGGTASDEKKIVLKKGCNLAPPRYRQGDPLWADDTYDSTQSTIKALGCALSSMAMVMTAFGDTVNPGEMNRWMKERILDDGGFYGNLVNWDAMKKHSATGITYRYFHAEDFGDTTKATDPSDFSGDIDNCALVIAQVYNMQTRNQHWVVVNRRNGSNYSITDPGRGETSLEGYGNRIWTYLVVSRQ